MLTPVAFGLLVLSMTLTVRTLGAIRWKRRAARRQPENGPDSPLAPAG